MSPQLSIVMLLGLDLKSVLSLIINKIDLLFDWLIDYMYLINFDQKMFW